MTEIITIFWVIKIRHGKFLEDFLRLPILTLSPLIHLVFCLDNAPSPEEGFSVSCHNKTFPNLSRHCKTVQNLASNNSLSRFLRMKGDISWSWALWILEEQGLGFKPAVCRKKTMSFVPSTPQNSKSMEQHLNFLLDISWEQCAAAQDYLTAMCKPKTKQLMKWKSVLRFI